MYRGWERSIKAKGEFSTQCARQLQGGIQTTSSQQNPTLGVKDTASQPPTPRFPSRAFNANNQQVLTGVSCSYEHVQILMQGGGARMQKHQLLMSPLPISAEEAIRTTLTSPWEVHFAAHHQLGSKAAMGEESWAGNRKGKPWVRRWLSSMAEASSQPSGTFPSLRIHVSPDRSGASASVPLSTRAGHNMHCASQRGGQARQCPGSRSRSGKCSATEQRGRGSQSQRPSHAQAVQGDGHTIAR